MTKSELLNELYKKYGLDKEDTFRSPQGWTIITRAGIDKIQAQADIDITFDCIEYTPGVSAAVKASAEWNSRKLETYGEANEKIADKVMFLQWLKKGLCQELPLN